MPGERDDVETRVSDVNRALSTMESDPGRPAPASRRTLVRVFGGSGRVRRFELVEGVTLLGRAVPPGSVPLSDQRASRVHASLQMTAGGVVVRDLSQRGVFVDGERVEEALVPSGGVLRAGDTLFVLRALPASDDDDGDDEGQDATGLLGISPAIRALRRQIALVARTDAWVVLLGETGTGKDVTARAIHRASGRTGELVPVNCGAIPEHLAESELFGHKKGAFTGADRDYDGVFLRAHGGTLFLDEIGEMPLAVQAKLLRALDERRVTRLGDRNAVDVDVRVIAATNRDLAREVQRGAFRADLFARLADVTLDLPPLRERREDVLLLLRDALDDDVPLAPDLAEALLCHAWPFNVRELKKAALELKVRGQGAPAYTLEMIEHRLARFALALEPNESGDAPRAEARAADATSATTREGAREGAPRAPSRDEVIALLRAHGGNLVDVAKAAGRSRKQVYRWLAKHELDADDYRPKP